MLSLHSRRRSIFQWDPLISVGNNGELSEIAVRCHVAINLIRPRALCGSEEEIKFSTSYKHFDINDIDIRKNESL